MDQTELNRLSLMIAQAMAEKEAREKAEQESLYKQTRYGDERQIFPSGQVPYNPALESPEKDAIEEPLVSPIDFVVPNAPDKSFKALGGLLKRGAKGIEGAVVEHQFAKQFPKIPNEQMVRALNPALAHYQYENMLSPSIQKMRKEGELADQILAELEKESKFRDLQKLLGNQSVSQDPTKKIVGE